MSERRLKLGHRKEYKRKSKHTRNPSYYPRHLTKVTLADFDADFNLRVSKEVAAQRGYGRKVLDKSCHIAWDHGYGYVKESRIVKFIAKYVGKPYKELAKAWNEWIKPIKNTDKTEYLDDYFTDYRWRQAFFRVDDNGLVQSVEQTPKGRRYNISTKQWKENRNHALPKFGKIAKPHKAADYYDYCYGFANSNPDSNGTDSNFYRPRLLGHYWCMVNGTPVELPVYHVRDARDYIRWWLDGKQGRIPGTREVVKVDTYQQLFRPGTHAYEQAVKFDNNWVYLPIPCSKGGYIGETSKHFMHLETEQIPNPRYAEIQSSLDALTKSVEDIEAGITVTFSDGESYKMFGKKQSAEPAKVTSTSLAEESAKIIDVFEKAVTNLKEVASRAQAEKEVREQEIIELQTEAANLEAVSNKATAMAEKIGGLLS